MSRIALHGFPTLSARRHRADHGACEKCGLAIDHVSLYVGDSARSKAYYEGLFDFSCTPWTEDPTVLLVESSAVHFFLIERQDLDEDCRRAQHLSFQVDSLDPVIATLKTRGESYKLGAFEGFSQRNFRWCEWRDPDGIRLECVAPLVRTPSP